MGCVPPEGLEHLPIATLCEWWVYLTVGLVVLAVVTGVLIVCCVPAVKRRVFPYRLRVAHRMTSLETGEETEEEGQKLRVLSPRARRGGVTRL